LNKFISRSIFHLILAFIAESQNFSPYNLLMKKLASYRLIPELVPEPLWGKSAYKMLGGRAAWKKRIRPDALTKSDNRCGICESAEERLICHDKWQYDDKAATATLIDFEIHCSACDSVTHFGRLAAGIGLEEALQIVVPHLCKINQCTADKAVQIMLDAGTIFNKHSQKKWKVMVAAALVKMYPELADLPSFTPARNTY